MEREATGGVVRTPNGGRLPLAIALAVVAAIAATYFFYSRGQRAYFSSRNLRLLAIVADQLEDSLRTNEGFVRNYGVSKETPKTYVAVSNKPDTEKTYTDPAIFLPKFDSAFRDCAPVPETSQERKPEFSRTLQWNRGEAVLTIAYQETAAPLPPIEPLNGVLRAPATAPAPELTLGFAPVLGDPCLGQTMLRRQATGSINLRHILDPIFSQSLLSAFDEVMLVRGDGSVIYAGHHNARRALSVRGEEESIPEQIVTNLGQLKEKIGFREPPAKLDLGVLRDVTRITEVQTSSGTYYLFTQPFSQASVDDDPATKAAEGRRWLIAGMVSKRRFMYEVMSVSASGVLVVMAIFLMMIGAWPYLRVALIGSHQRLAITDVLLLGFAALIHAAILTLLVLDVLAYRSLRAVSDKQLTLLGERLESDLYRNLSSAAETLRKLDEWGTDPTAKSRWALSDMLTFQAADPGANIAGLKLPNPYVSIVAWMDAAGRQRYKMTMREAAPPVNVGYRQYFQNALANRLASVDGDPENGIAIESIRSSASGETEAVVARPTKAHGLSVVAATVELIDITHPVLPPDFGFAIIDDSGKVLFHSESSRNNQENFFAETDWNRTVRSAVFARQEVLTGVRYWGADHRVYVKPLKKLPWTLIVFRNKSLLRTVNTEVVAMTLSMLLGNSAIYLVIILLLLFWNPMYRAPQAWPVPENTESYVRLILLYLVMAASACFTFYAFDARSVLMITMLLPAQALTGTLLVLEQRRTSLRWIAAASVWIGIVVLWLLVLLHSGLMPGTRVQHQWLLMVIVALLLLGATAWMTFGGFRFLFEDEWQRKYYSRIYLVAGVLLLVHGAVIPTVGFFKVASRLEIEGLVKYTERVIAERAEEAIVGIERANTTDATQEEYCARWQDDPFRIRWRLSPPTKNCRSLIPDLTSPDVMANAKLDRVWLPDVYRNVLPAYSEESVSLRQLHGNSVTDALWRWWWNDNRITLDKSIHLPAIDEGRQGAAVSIYGRDQKPQSIQVQSRVPLSFAAAWRYDAGMTSRSAIWAVAFLLGVVIVVAILVLIVRFFALRLFLVDIREPLWLAAPPPLKPTLGDHIFLVREGKSVEKLTEARGEQVDFINVTFEELDQDKRPAAWDEKLLEIDRAAQGKNVRIFDFEYGAAKPAVAMRILQFLERLLALPNRTVIMASTVSPSAFLVMITNADLQKRWAKLLDSFVWVTASQLEVPPSETDAPKTRDNPAWLHRETAQGEFLRSLRDELEPLARVSDREQLIDEIRERSNAYYGGLWASCSADEKILLHQLAREGLMNGKDRKAVRRLLARGLVRRGPNLRIFNDTFRLYVLASARREQVPIDSQEGLSAWDTIRLPLFVVIVSSLVIIFATQKDMLNLATGLVAALTTGLPAIVRLFGFFTERRAGAAEKSG